MFHHNMRIFKVKSATLAAALTIAALAGCAATPQTSSVPVTVTNGVAVSEALYQGDLTAWAREQLKVVGESGASRQTSFLGVSIKPLTAESLHRIVAANAGIKVLQRPAADAVENKPYLGSPAPMPASRDVVVTVDQIRFDSDEELPYGFRINGRLPFTVLPSTSARMSSVRIVEPEFATYFDGNARLELSLGTVEKMEIAGWQFATPWILVVKSITDGASRQITHTIGLDVLKASGGLRVTTEQAAVLGDFDSSSCAGSLRWSSAHQLLAKASPTAGWQPLELAAKGVLSQPKGESRDDTLLRKFSATGGGIDLNGMRYCAPGGVMDMVQDAHIIRDAKNSGF